MNKLVAIMSLCALSACSQFDMQGYDPNDYYAEHPVESQVGPNGELITPTCPDWRTSPVTTFSNSRQGNIGCSTVTNLGLMLEDPRDLERGASGGNISPDSNRSADAIHNYRIGLSPLAGSTSTSTTSTDGASTNSAPPSGGGQ